MEEIGGYFGLECKAHVPYHRGVYLNSGSNAFKHIIATLGIKRLWCPKYTCRCIAREARIVGCCPIPYEVDSRLMPLENFGVNDFILYNNYFGVCGENVRALASRYPKLIVDNAQAFYSRQIGMAGFYSPHKFFGVPDGGIAIYSDSNLNVGAVNIPFDHSCERVECMLRRMDENATAGYAGYQATLEELAHAPIRRMSKLTSALMGNVDFSNAAKRRMDNFSVLHKTLRSEFPFALATDDVPMIYPYVTHDRRLKQRLIASKIYVATYWPDMDGCEELRDSIVPLPIDQRYGRDDMMRVLEVVHAR